LSDQTEKPKGALPKGYEPNAQGEPQDQDKKIWDKYYNGEIELPDVVKELKHYRNSKDTELETSDEDQREKDLKEYEDSYITRLEKNKPEESSDDFRVELGVSTESDDDLGKLNLRKHTVTKREELQEERLAYEQKYLDRYAEPKLKKKVSSSLYKPEKPKPKRNMKKERKEYEQNYLSRYKHPKLKKKASSSLYKPEIPKPKRDMKKERKEYEQKYLSRYKQPKSKPTKSSNLKHDTDLGTLTLRQYVNAKRKTKQDEIREYEKQYLSRYKQPKTKKNVGSDLYKPETPKPKLDMKKERKKYEQKYLSRYKQPKSGVKKSTSWTQHDVALGRLSLSPHFNAKRRAKQDEIREYEKQYLSRYKQPKSGVKKSSNLKHDTDLGTLTLRQYVNAKRKAKQDEIKEYEQKYLSRYKQPKTKKVASSDLYKPEIPKPKRDMKKERKKYEQKYLSR